MGLHFGGFGVNRGVAGARGPVNMRVNPLTRSRVGPGALAALLLDWNCGAVAAEVLAAGPFYWQC